MSEEILKPGQKIRFLRTLEEGPSAEAPGRYFAGKGAYGTIDKVGGCKEGFWVFWEGWRSASFGCAREDFYPVYETDEEKECCISQINLDAYCSTDETRPYITKPFLVGGYAVATNGHVMVMIPEDMHPDVVKDSDAPNETVLEIIALFSDAEFKLADVPDYPAKQKCLVCVGAGKVSFTDCKECHGDGAVNFFNDFNEYEHTCQSCKGCGHKKRLGHGASCIECCGTGLTYKHNDIKDGIDYMGGLVNPNYLEQALTNMVHPEVCYLEGRRMYLFSFGRAKAIVMGMNKYD